MAQYNDLFGSILVGSWLTSIVYGIMLYQSWEYLETYPKDMRFRKALLLCCVTTCTVAMIAQYANVYYPTVTFWGNTVAIQKQYWPVPVYVICNCFTGVMVDSFLIDRVYRISKNLPLCLFLAACVLVSLAGSIMVGIIISMASALTSREKARTAALIWTVGTAAADIGVAAALIWKLVTMKSNFKSTNSLIHRIVIGTIQTGSTTSAIAIMTMASAYIGSDESNAPTAFHYFIGPFYVLTLLYNLRLQRPDGTSGSQSRTFSGDTRRGTNNICMDGIQVHRTAIVTMDPPDGQAPSSTRTGQESYGETKLKQDDVDSGPFAPKTARVPEF